LSALIFGLLPVLRYVRPQLAAALRSETRGSIGSREHLRARGALVVVQVALAFALLVSAGLMIRTFRELGSVDPGFTRPDQIQTLRVTIPPSSLPDPELTVRRQQAILDGIAALPGVESVAYASELPMQAGNGQTDLLVTQGGSMSRGELPQNRALDLVSPGYFATMGTLLVAGRDYSWADVYGRRAVAVISEDLATREWGSPAAALGKRLRGGSARNIWREVVGVVGNVHNRGVSEPAGATVYLPALHDGGLLRRLGGPHVVHARAAGGPSVWRAPSGSRAGCRCCCSGSARSTLRPTSASPWPWSWPPVSPVTCPRGARPASTQSSRCGTNDMSLRTAERRNGDPAMTRFGSPSSSAAAQ
jgi:hypothetical protein